MVLIVAGRPLHAHRVVLARRSAPLRELITQEERPGDQGMLELLLPELNYEVARALLEFLYSDNLRTPLDQMLLYDLLSAADAFQLPRLVRPRRCQCPLHAYAFLSDLTPQRPMTAGCYLPAGARY